MKKAHNHLIEALKTVSGEKHHQRTIALKKELGKLINRFYPATRMEVAALVNPARFGKAVRKKTREDVKTSETWVHPDLREGAAPAPKKKVAAEAGPSPDDKDEGREEGLDIRDLSDDDLVDSFGGLPAAKEWIEDNGGKIARNATTEKTAKAIRKVLKDAEGNS